MPDSHANVGTSDSSRHRLPAVGPSLEKTAGAWWSKRIFDQESKNRTPRYCRAVHLLCKQYEETREREGKKKVKGGGTPII